ncbi:Y-family DNA polymerase [Aquisediminimonas sediminicola]|uniref:Y-family DNA polymerase n=1 Tax=Alteraquisediminimonas sediminicola TaxID=2676787 RepID=UPI001C8EAF60|nr:type VI secretion protein ImpB [Aquisediminimonas sediminicola]
MRKPATIEHLYLDFDGFFASVEQQRDPRLRGRPVGVVPYEGGRTCIIACSKEAKAYGVKNVMMVDEARRICRDLVLVPQKPDLYRRAHNALLAEIASVIPIDTVKSIDELACTLDESQRSDPSGLAMRIKRTIRYNIGATITCSIGFAANRHLAKIAGGTQKPDGLTIWHPHLMPGPLLKVPLEDIPGVGRRMAKRLAGHRVSTTGHLLELAPKQMRAIWRNVTGERLWYALHGYAIESPASGRAMFGHARVLPPDARSLDAAYQVARLLLTKAARRMRRADYYCSGLMLWLRFYDDDWSTMQRLPQVNDDQAVLAALATMWEQMRAAVGPKVRVMRVGVTLCDLTPATARQLDMLLNDDHDRQKWEAVGAAIDGLNARFGRTVASLGPWLPPAGGNVGGKISFTRIPAAEDFQ